MIRRENRDTIYYGYDEADRLTSERWQAAQGGTIYAFQWDYDLVGNRVYESAAGVRGGTVESPAETYYEHDAANELTRSRQIGGDHPGYTYYAYDSRGNCTHLQEPEGTSYFEYNDADLVDSIHYRTGVWNYFYYDAQLRRYAIQESTGLTYLTWDRNGMNLLMERDAQGNVTAECAHGYTPTDGIGSMIGARKTVGGVPWSTRAIRPEGERFGNPGGRYQQRGRPGGCVKAAPAQRPSADAGFFGSATGSCGPKATLSKKISRGG